MKTVRINAGKVGLVFKNGDFKTVLTEGLHWVGLFKEVRIYDMNLPFTPSADLALLLRNPALNAMLEVVKVSDNQIGVLFYEGNFHSVLKPGKYAFWKEAAKYTWLIDDVSNPNISPDFSATMLNRNDFIPYVLQCNVASYEKGVLFIDNKVNEILEPGKYFYWKAALDVSILKIDMRQTQLEVSGQEMLTKDKAGLRMNFFASYRVKDVMKAATENKDFRQQIYVYVQFALREFVGSLNLDEMLNSKEALSTYVRESLEEKAENLGVEILGCGLKDIILPGEMKEIMNQVLIAQKRAQANVIARREETASTRSMLNTAKLMEENEMLIRLKEMEYIEKIAEKVGEITISGNGKALNELKQIFISK